MAHWALINKNNKVIQVIVADEVPSSLKEKGRWLQTSYNTNGGVHALGGTPLRKNFATIGGTYDEQRDAFIPKKPLPSFVFDEETCTWVPPVSKPKDGCFVWDETTVSWVACSAE